MSVELDCEIGERDARTYLEQFNNVTVPLNYGNIGCGFSSEKALKSS